MQSPAVADGSQPSPSTSKFLLNLPRAVQSTSPSLAALHISRARLLYAPSSSQNPFTTTHCSRCGTYLLDGTGLIRTVRRSRGIVQRKGKSRVEATIMRSLRRVCSICGHAEDIPTDIGNASIFPKVRREKAGQIGVVAVEKGPEPAVLQPAKPMKSLPSPSRQSAASSRAGSVLTNRPSSTSQPSRVSTPVPTPTAQLPAPLSTQPGAVRNKTRSKKKAGLQDMLARNRERQEQEKRAEGFEGGLASFLENLSH